MRIQAESSKEKNGKDEHLQYLRRDDFESPMFYFMNFFALLLLVVTLRIFTQLMQRVMSYDIIGST